MAEVKCIGQPANESERRAIRALRDDLPADWRIFHNFEIYRNKQVFEIDIAILAYHAVYLVDIKGTRGIIEVDKDMWHPRGRPAIRSPLKRLHNHAKAMAAAIRESDTGLPDLENVWVHATVLLTADDADIIDREDIDLNAVNSDVIRLKECNKYFRDTSYTPNSRLKDIVRFHDQIAKVITGNARPKALMFGHWKVIDDRLGRTDRYIEYRAEHNRLGKSGGMARLRVYQVDPYQDEAAREEEIEKISNVYRAVAHMPAHANVLAVKDLFLSDDEDEVVLVTEDLPGQTLRPYINKVSRTLTFDRKLRVMRDVLEALDHVHQYEVIHRNLTPDAILVTKDGQARVTGFDFARVGKNPTSTIGSAMVNDLEADYQAPECTNDLTQASTASDLFAAGRIFYHLLANELLSSEHNPGVLPKGINEWLQKFCESDSKERHASAASARKVLDGLIRPRTKNDFAPDASGLVVVQPPLPDNLIDLPPGSFLANLFRIQEKLGGGDFDATYKVFDFLGHVVRVIKLGQVSPQRIQTVAQRVATLTELPDHRHVVKALWAERMVDVQQTPYMYIVLEYVDGRAVSDLINAEELSRDEAMRIVCEAAEGLAHLHKHDVYHRDIKPSHLLWTAKGVRIIGFHVAVSENNEVQGDGGTRRYLPPDYDCSSEMEASDWRDPDLYALGISLYECLTDNYPFDARTPPPKTQPKDPRQFKGCADLSPALVEVLVKMIAPERKDRFMSAKEFLRAITEVERRRPMLTDDEIGARPKVVPNGNAGDGKTTSIQPLPSEPPTSLTTNLSQTILAEETEAVGAQETSLDPDLSDMSPPMSEPEAPGPAEPGSGLGRMITMPLLVLGAVAVLILFVVRPSWWEELQRVPGEYAPVVTPTPELLPTATVAVVSTVTPESPTMEPDDIDIFTPTPNPLPTATVAVVLTATPEVSTVGPDDEKEASPSVRTVEEAQPAVPYLLATTRMRAGPGEEFVDKGELEAGAEVTLIGTSEDAAWFMLANRYWIPAAAVSQVQGGLSVRVPPYALVNANVRVRSTADAPRIRGVKANETLVLTGRQEGINPDGVWYRLDTGGWIFGDLVADAPEDLPEVE